MNGDPLDELDEQAAEITRLRGENEKLRGIIRIQDAAIRSRHPSRPASAARCGE